MGSKPQPRQGHSSQAFDRKLIIVGGCDYYKNACYNDTWALETTKMNFEVLDRKNHGYLLGVGKTSIVGGKIYFFGGCFTNKYCEANIKEMTIGLGCASGCSQHGICSDGRCVCQGGFYGNECEK